MNHGPSILRPHPSSPRFVARADWGTGARTDEGRIRAAAVSHGIPCITTIQAADAAVLAMEALRGEEMTVQAVQDRLPQYGGRKG